MLLSVDQVNKSYPGSRPVLQNVSMTMEQGDTLALTGESGSGKSTLLNLVAALDEFDKGEITLGTAKYSTLDDAGRAELRRTQVALVFQQFNLIPSLSVEQNLSFHARLGHRASPEWIAYLTERLGLMPLLSRYPEHLSGGQQQRVAIGRALALKPALLLADEPTGNLDGTASKAVMALMLELVRETGAALLLVTHSNAIADQLDHRIHLADGQIT